jgi:hypothetical protein
MGDVFVVTDVALLARLVAEELRKMPAETSSAPTATLLDRRGIAQYLDLGLASIDRMCAKGCPYMRAGDVKRFILADVLAWMKGRATKVEAKPQDPDMSADWDRILP